MSVAAGTVTSGMTESTAGRSTSGGRGRGRGRSRGNRTQAGRGQNRASGRNTTFKGTTAEMNGNVFECYDEQSDRRQYAKSIEALEGYVKKELTYSEDMAPLFAFEMKEPQVVKPVKAPVPEGYVEDEADKLLWHEELKEYVKRQRAMTGNLANVHAVIWGQCSEAMKAKVKSNKEYEAKAATNNCHWFLKEIRAITLQFDQKHNVFVSLMDAKASFYNCRQQQGQSADSYLEELKGWSDNIEYHGGSVSESFTLIPDMDDDGEPRTLVQRTALARDRTLATALIRGADQTRYGTLIVDLSNQFAMGKDEYPTTLTAAYSLLVTYKTPLNANGRGGSRNGNGNYHTNTAPTVATSTAPEVSAMTFAQQGGPIPGTDGITHGHITCFNCNHMGHYASACPTEERGTSGTTLLQYGYMLAQAAGCSTGIDSNWVLLDSQSTISVFCNPAMLTNIRPSPHVLRAVTNGGHQDSSMLGDFPNLGPVWYNPKSIANILSLSEVRKVCRVTMDTGAEVAMCVHRVDGTIMKFMEHPSGLYVFDPSTTNDTSTTTVTGYTFLSTVSVQKQMFSPRQIKDADTARTLYRMIGRPDEAHFQVILRRNMIRNCPVTPEDAKRALVIYGPDVATLKGKTTKTSAAPHTPTFEAVPLPPPVLEHHRNVTLCIDFFFVQGHAYFHTISRDIGFRTVTPVSDRTMKTILRETHAVIKLYHARGFFVRDLHVDNEFECIRHHLLPIVLNVVPADSHVGEVERSIRTIKERLRATIHGLPFKRVPKLLIHHMVADSVRCLNLFPRRTGISPDLSPVSLVTGVASPDYTAMRVEFGQYVQVFEDSDPSNTPRARSLGAIAMTPTGNVQGDFNFLSLATGARISRHQWTALPITDAAISRVEALAHLEGQPLIQARGLVVEWRPDHPVDDDEYDRPYEPAAAPVDDVLHADDYDDIDDLELADLAYADVVPVFAPRPHVVDQGANGPIQPIHEFLDDETDEMHEDEDQNHEVDEMHEDADQNHDYGDAENDDDNGADNHGQDEGAPQPVMNNDDNHGHDEGAPWPTNHTDNDEGATDEVEEHPPAIRYNLRHNPTATRRFNQAIDEPYSRKAYYPPTQLLQTRGGLGSTETQRCHMLANTELRKMIFGLVMTQMSAKAGIKKHGAAAEAALMSEFTQLEDLGVYESIDPNTLTKAQKKAALRSINLIKEKRCGKLKGRTVADGRPQKALYDKSETASPTVSTDGLMLSIMIDAHEGRDVATADVTGAYLKAYMTDFVIMKFTGDPVDILCKMNPRHNKFVVIENGTKVLYVRLVKAIYGCVKSAMLWYDLFTGTLKEMGFVLNPYDPCIANSTIKGKQCTIAWYVGDNKISHVDPEVVTMVIEKMEQRFDKMTVTRGKEHVFLGMNIRYTDKNTAVITMRDYLLESIEESGMDIERESATPAKKNLFEVDSDAMRLSGDRAESFHSVVCKLLYVAIRARMDILLAVGFLCTRVSKSTVEDEVKLKRVLEYIKGSMDKEYTLGADDLGRMRSWVDASYAVHPDMRSHTGGVTSFGTGGIVCKSSKQKLNTKSSTEAEVVGASDYLPHTLWVKMFMEAQGYDMNGVMFEQDNESAIRLEKNGRASAGPRSRHIDIRYFWIKDRTKLADITIRHCPTLQMLGDFFTKPLQGNLFRKFCDAILGYTHVDTLKVTFAPSTEERVGDKQSIKHGRNNPGELSKESEESKTVFQQSASVKQRMVVLPSTSTDKKETAEGKNNVRATGTKTTWADVVMRSTSGTKRIKSNVKIVSGAFSRNNPVN